jgi:hypothetical protein
MNGNYDLRKMVRADLIDIEDFISQDLIYNRYEGFTKIVAGNLIKRGQLLMVLKPNF